MKTVDLSGGVSSATLSLNDLATVLGIHQVTVARWETNFYPIPMLLGLALETIRRELPKSHREQVRRVNRKAPA